MTQSLVPPFTAATARAKVQAAADAWNTRNPDVVVLTFSEHAEWRTRDEQVSGRDSIRDCLIRNWARELHCHLQRELWAYAGSRIAVRLEFEWQHNRTGQWYRSFGSEHWEFDDNGLLRRCEMSANDIAIEAGERRICLKRIRSNRFD